MSDIRDVSVDVKYFLLFNGFIVALIVLSMLLRHKKLQEGPSRLDMRGLAAKPADPGAEKATKSVESRNLNVLFEFDGKVWDAHQVLQVPAGCTSRFAEENYRRLKAQNGGRDLDLVEKAFSELKKCG